MSSDIAIKVEQLSKCFHIYDKPHDRLLQMFARGRRQYYREFWALRDVSFEVVKGETVGIIGHNGSGKSTLLQMICGTLNPTSGTVQAQGRIAALLELGAGFNPEFTGRENVYLNAAILGLTKDEIDERFDAIAAFADIGEFMERPIKSYSSGMYVRLAFAVQSMIDPDIFIVDEALAVGDEKFQRKCFSRLEKLKESGTSILFVSHSASQIIELCDRVVMVDGGEALAIGEPKKVVALYQKLLYAAPENRQEIRSNILSGVFDDASGSEGEGELAGQINHVSNEEYDSGMVPESTVYYESHGAKISRPEIINHDGKRVNHLQRGRRYCYRYCVEFEKGAVNIRFGMLIKTISGVDLGGYVSADSPGEGITYIESGRTVEVMFDFTCNLNPGVYFMNAGVQGEIGVSGDTYLHRAIDLLMFKVDSSSDRLPTGPVDFLINSSFAIR